MGLFNLRKLKKEAASHLESRIEDLKRRLDDSEGQKNRALAVLESMVEGVMVVDSDQKVLLVNSRMSRMFDLKKEGVEHRHFWEVFRDPRINEMIEKTLKERVSASVEHSILLSDSVFQIQVSPVFGEGGFLGVVAVFHDVTKLKELERTRSEFVANVSHELKTPLTSILGFVETLKEGAIDDPEHRLKFLQIIEEHSKKLNSLIEDLLQISKLESAKEGLRKEPMDFEKLLGKILKILEMPIESKKIEVRLEIHPKPFSILAEPKLIEQAFSNLIDNAVKYNHPGGDIIIKAFYEDGFAVIQVTDTGVGIPEVDRERIFERFYRVDRSRARDSGGTGLGLSIVKHIIERHGGRITARSEAQKGATFIIRLPR